MHVSLPIIGSCETPFTRPVHLGVDEGLAAGGRATEMIARLESDVCGGAFCALACNVQCIYLCVRHARLGVEPLADHLAVFDEHAADARVRKRPALTLPRKL